MRIAIYGGSFNPPHVGHGLVASWVLWTGKADEVWLMPTFEHPFGKKLVDFDQRVAWCEVLARTVDPSVRVSRKESELPRPSYTVDTLDALHLAHPEHEFSFVVGADVLADLPKWKDWERLARTYPPIVVGRQGYTGPAECITFPGVSSSEVRRRVAAGEAIDHLVPAAYAEGLSAFYRS